MLARALAQDSQAAQLLVNPQCPSPGASLGRGGEPCWKGSAQHAPGKGWHRTRTRSSTCWPGAHLGWLTVPHVPVTLPPGWLWGPQIPSKSYSSPPLRWQVEGAGKAPLPRQARPSWPGRPEPSSGHTVPMQRTAPEIDSHQPVGLPTRLSLIIPPLGGIDSQPLAASWYAEAQSGVDKSLGCHFHAAITRSGSCPRARAATQPPTY